MTNLAPLTWQDCVQPDWQVSPRVRALITTRDGGVSEGPYGRWQDGVALPGGMNLGLHTGDDPDHVAVNRARVLALAGQSRAAWLEQVHGARIVQADEVIAAAPAATAPVQADASVTNQAGAVCVVMVADCLPVLLCDAQGRAVGAAHAGWRGLAAGIVEQTAARVAALAGGATDALHAYLGPAIGPRAFEVGAEVRDAFLDTAAQSEHDETRHAFVAIDGAPGKFLADLYALARLRLARAGVAHVSGGTACTVTEPARFYSYRRDRVTGRMAAAIWLAD
ncbi:peptidoglycan editing factor PgeF [Burkholderia cenocepacia]|uniref:peptidoglycan editing factor PgeF n=1 Tax=Burkholderia cenocepacia TaxID=95486 RepID=UPI001CF3D9A6|nr:peptidoglycan editing factor PgeF [Burkholderia cenocepacia]MCA7965135.1 peptidoglycan editing factor PgeF [Burkholderia cenocepacia]MDR8058050.1 peptidoglycan editing factor PgeF [Burkholderia cenocepacia]MDR8061858.1 peptidoglycan editing factor PgeF [Burkholderia cenocepacia]MEC4770746.1 peptidoglycan editing factor PgeF [Burkholderia cenocepacia]